MQRKNRFYYVPPLQRRIRTLVLVFSFSFLFFVPGLISRAQTTSASAGTVHGSVVDPSGAVVPGATVEMQNPVSHFSQTVQTDANGTFVFHAVPYNNYHLSVSVSGFQNASQDVNVQSPVPLEVKIALTIGAAESSVTVTSEANDLVQPVPVTQTDVDRELFDKLPLESQSSGLHSHLQKLILLLLMRFVY